jgi:hypothetical protein
MANALYNKAKQAFTAAQINWPSDTIKAVVVDLADYTFAATHEFLSSVPAGARVTTSPALASKTNTNGVCDAADVTLTAVTGDSIEAVIVYVDTGSDATSRLLCFIDTGITGFPITPNGGDVILRWHASGIFSL